MAALDDYIQQQSSTEDQQLRQAMHAADWTQTFSGPQSTAALRAQRNVTDMVNGAIQRKIELAAQTDKNAQQIYQQGEQFKEWQQQAPLRDELLRSKIAAEGASGRYKQQQDAATLGQVSNFYRGLNGIQHPIGTPEHAAAVMELAAQNPLAASTGEISDMLKTHAQVHDTASKLKQAVADYTQAFGVAPTSFETTATGGINLRGKTEDGTTIPTSIAKHFAALQGTIAGHMSAAENEKQANMKANLPNVPYSNSLELDTAKGDLAALMAQYPSLAPAPVAAPAAKTESLDTPEGFTAAFQTAPSGTILHYKGKAYKKP